MHSLKKKFQPLLSPALSEARALSLIALGNKKEKRAWVEGQEKEYSASAIENWEKESSDSLSTTNF